MRVNKRSAIYACSRLSVTAIEIIQLFIWVDLVDYSEWQSKTALTVILNVCDRETFHPGRGRGAKKTGSIYQKVLSSTSKR